MLGCQAATALVGGNSAGRGGNSAGGGQQRGWWATARGASARVRSSGTCSAATGIQAAAMSCTASSPVWASSSRPCKMRRSTLCMPVLMYCGSSVRASCKWRSASLTRPCLTRCAPQAGFSQLRARPTQAGACSGDLRRRRAHSRPPAGRSARERCGPRCQSSASAGRANGASRPARCGLAGDQSGPPGGRTLQRRSRSLSALPGLWPETGPPGGAAGCGGGLNCASPGCGASGRGGGSRFTAGKCAGARSTLRCSWQGAAPQSGAVAARAIRTKSSAAPSAVQLPDRKSAARHRHAPGRSARRSPSPAGRRCAPCWPC